MTSIVISSGHGKYIRGASGSPVPPQCDEVDEARKVVEAVATKLRSAGVTVKTFHDDTSHDQNTNLNTIVNYHNKQTRDLDVSVHFNATPGAHGTEVLWVTQKELATKVCNAICAAGKFTNRGQKYRDNLFFLNKTDEPSILIETCFCDSTSDCNLYREHFDAICAAIAQSIGGTAVPIPPEPEPAPEPEPVPGENRVVVTTKIEGDVTTYLNGTMIHGHEGCEHVFRADVELIGDVTLVVNGEEFHNTPAPPPVSTNHDGVTATEFGGSGDPNDSAYDGKPLNDTDLYVALPVNVTDAAQRDRGVRVYNRATGKNAVGKVRDKGPWMVDDKDYVFGDAEAIASVCFAEESPLPRGPNAGMVPTNDAAIDLSPALAKAIGISGKGKVDWEFA